MNIHDASYKALKAFERAPGSVRRREESQPLNAAERDSWTRQVRGDLAMAQTVCGDEQHRVERGPSSERFENSPYLRYSSTTSRSTETWTNPQKNSFVQVKDEVTTSDSQGFSLSGSTVYDSCGYRKRQDASYGIETSGYIAGMKIADDGYTKKATAFKIDKRQPEESWVQEWNIR
jgi:hypothetical protein